MQRAKIGKKKNEQPDPKWRHSDDAVEKGKVSYNCKFWGSTPVTQSKGSELIKESIKKLQFANDIKKSEEGLKASKLKKVELCISTQNLILTDLKSKTTLYSFPLQRVSYCADDKTSKKLFGFIARDKETSQHQCYILECEKNAEELTLAVGQAFELAYKRYKANQAETGKDVSQMKQRVQNAEKENEVLRKKLEEMEKMNQKQAAPPSLASVAAAPANQSNVQTNVSQPPAQQPFDPFAESSVSAFESSPFDIQSPPPFQNDPRPLPPGVPVTGVNPFAVPGPTEPQAVSNNNHAGGDLLDIFGSEPQQASNNSQSLGDDIFDPLAQINGAQEPPPPQPNFSSFDQQQAPVQANIPAFDQAQSQPAQLASVSRPRPAAASAGLLPPPPTKQSIKEKNRSSVPGAEQMNGAPGLNTHAEAANNPQGLQEVQNGMQNNLVLF
ncbi:PTB domain-containing engulfment adapter protein 1-like [Dendronephthya gigantea]|uniref:PTB domain-containing engulfment adapter protein 1-like n=1 Tax=Dendronephthya gigantea TaxID=151771 RepID=UPI00106A8D36|nr:PTB domain-containing engulfment adapter protein 1-like [Dendronephthya gigantea]